MALRLLLEPLDVWLFRDGRPFTAGSDALARSRFPPTPYTVYGMLRSLLLFQAAARGAVRDLAFGQEREVIARTVGAADDFGRVRLRGPLLGRLADGRIRRYLPAPADLVCAEAQRDDGTRWANAASPAAEHPHGASSASKLQPLWARHAERPSSVAGGWLAEEDFQAYLAGSPTRVVQSDALFARELRPGVGIDRQRRTAAEGLLYAIEYIRPQPGVGVVVDVLDGCDAVPPLLAFGGEARGTRCTTVQLAADPPPPEVRERIARSGLIKLVLAKPALFAQGWLPSWVDPATLETRGDRPALRLVSAAVPRAEPIGGFDVVAGKPRATRYAVAAGSVYFFAERQAGAAAAAFDRWYGQCVSDLHAEIGFGLSYAGGWEYV